jgi:hypothetical protein
VASGGELVTVKDPGPALQRAANAKVPLGWCQVCIGAAKLALGNGEVPEPIQAAVTMIARLQNMEIPGVGTMPAVFTIPACWDHIGSSRQTGLVAGQPGLGLGAGG